MRLATNRDVPESDIWSDRTGRERARRWSMLSHASIMTRRSAPKRPMDRALFLARHAGIDAVGVGLPSPFRHRSRFVGLEAVKTTVAFLESYLGGAQMPQARGVGPRRDRGSLSVFNLDLARLATAPRRTMRASPRLRNVHSSGVNVANARPSRPEALCERPPRRRSTRRWRRTNRRTQPRVATRHRPDESAKPRRIRSSAIQTATLRNARREAGPRARATSRPNAARGASSSRSRSAGWWGFAYVYDFFVTFATSSKNDRPRRCATPRKETCRIGRARARTSSLVRPREIAAPELGVNLDDEPITSELELAHLDRDVSERATARPHAAAMRGSASRSRGIEIAIRTLSDRIVEPAREDDALDGREATPTSRASSSTCAEDVHGEGVEEQPPECRRRLVHRQPIACVDGAIPRHICRGRTGFRGAARAAAPIGARRASSDSKRRRRRERARSRGSDYAAGLAVRRSQPRRRTGAATSRAASRTASPRAGSSRSSRNATPTAARARRTLRGTR